MPDCGSAFPVPPVGILRRVDPELAVENALIEAPPKIRKNLCLDVEQELPH
jgi:hypothetical protein